MTDIYVNNLNKILSENLAMQRGKTEFDEFHGLITLHICYS